MRREAGQTGWAIIFAVPALLLIGCSGGSPTGPALSSKSVLRGTVMDGSGPVAGAEIVVDGSETGVFTDDQGRFQVPVEEGEHSVAAEINGRRSRPVGCDSRERDPVVLEVGDAVHEEEGSRREDDRERDRREEEEKEGREEPAGEERGSGGEESGEEEKEEECDHGEDEEKPGKEEPPLEEEGGDEETY